MWPKSKLSSMTPILMHCGAGVDVNTKDSEGFTGLMLALLQNRDNLVGLLQEREDIDNNSRECTNSDDTTSWL